MIRMPNWLRSAFAFLFSGAGLTLHEYRINIERLRRKRTEVAEQRRRLFEVEQLFTREIMRLESEASAIRSRNRQSRWNEEL